jgi:diphthine synthase
MTLFLIGLGLSDEKDITLRGLEAVKKCSKVYLENYTSLLQCSVSDVERIIGKKIILADRSQTENKSDDILNEAKKTDIALLVVGDPFAATTHINYLIECKKRNIPLKIIHNASIMTAVGEIGLELYKYGKVTSVPFAESETPYDAILDNLKNNLHTLVLFDLDPKTKKFMTIAQAVEKLMVHDIKKNLTMIIACARLGSENAHVAYGTLEEIRNINTGNPPYCLVVPSKKLHFIEEEALELWRIK